MCFYNMCENVRKSNLCETGGVCVYYFILSINRQNI